MDPDQGDLEMLSRQECLSLLRGVDVGRVGLSLNALPVILAVRFILAGDDIVFSSPRATVDAALVGTVVCFEADQPGSGNTHGWSVLVTGRAWPLQRSRERGTPPAVDESDGQLVRLSADLVSGRRGPLDSRALAGLAGGSSPMGASQGLSALPGMSEGAEAR